MPEEPTTTDLVELTRRSIDAQKESIEAAMKFYAPDAVWDASWGMGVFEGQEAVRDFFRDWRSGYDEIVREIEAIRDVGNGVTFAVIVQTGRVLGSSSTVQLRYGSVMEWSGGLIVRNTTYTDTDEARAAAERLAEERGQAMSENLELVRSIFGAWERGDFGSVEWAHPDIELVITEGPDRGTVKGVGALAQAWGDFLRTWEDYRVEAEEYRELDGDRVLVLMRHGGRGGTSGLDVEQLKTEGANLFHVRDGKVAGLALYWERGPMFTDLGLAE